jgi:hypothetical protein
MSRLPLMVCPACCAEMSIDVVFGHVGTREAVIALADLDPAAKLIPAAMRYCALFAPAKQRLRHERLATLLQEVKALVAPATIQHKGRSWAAPRDYWVAAMDDMTSAPTRDELKLPMGSHNYLRAIVAGYAEKAEGKREMRHEASLRANPQWRQPEPTCPPLPPPVVVPTPRVRPSAETFQRMRDAIKPKEEK